MADLATLPDFAFRYTIEGYVGSPPNTVAYGSFWADDQGNNQIIFGNVPANEQRFGRNRPASIIFNNGTVASGGGKGTDSAINIESCGVAICAQFPTGRFGGGFIPILMIGTTGDGGGLCIGSDSDGNLAVSLAGGASPATFGRLPCGPTVILVDQDTGGSELWVKILGVNADITLPLPSVYDGPEVYIFKDEGSNYFRGAADELAFFTASGTVRNNWPEIEQDLMSRYSIVKPTVGNCICIGDSIGQGSYQLGSLYWPTAVAEAIPEWYVINNSTPSYTMADVLADASILIDNASDRVLGDTKPLMFAFYLGTNEIFNEDSAASIEADATALVSYVRTNYPNASIIWNTIVPLNSPPFTPTQTEFIDLQRRTYNQWLRNGGLSQYNITLMDLAAVPSFIPAGTTNALIRDTVRGPNYTTYNTSFVAGVDEIHWGNTGIIALRPTIIGAAQRAEEQLSGGTFRDRNRSRPPMAVR